MAGTDMPEQLSLTTTIVASIGLAFVLGYVAHRMRIPLLVGYLTAGIVLSPATPWFIGNVDAAQQLAEIGVIFLMFGVGLHFSLKDLLSVKGIAVPGAIVQITLATLLGMGLGWLLGWPWSSGFVFVIALSTASTVVLLRAVQERGLFETTQGRIGVGWLMVEDLAMVLTMVLLPVLAGFLSGADAGDEQLQNVWLTTALTLGKLAAFVALMMIVGRHLIPWILHVFAHEGAREVFRLAVIAIALGVAYAAATLFDVSFALGAFFAGMILNESSLSHRAAKDVLPLRDAFAVLFFVSVGMLFDPVVLAENPIPVIATVGIIVFGKSIAAYMIVIAFGYPRRTALTISASLAQIGEFSFIVAALGVGLGLLPKEGQDFILVGAIISILINPLCFLLLDKFRDAKTTAGSNAADPQSAMEERDTALTSLRDHTVIIGCGRVGSLLAEVLYARRMPMFVIDERADRIATLRDRSIEGCIGDAANSVVLNAANLPAARRLIVAIPGAFEAGSIAQQARTINPNLIIIARSHSDATTEHLRWCGVDYIFMGERQIAEAVINHLNRSASKKAEYNEVGSFRQERMDTVLNPVRLENWYHGCLNDTELGHALDVDEKIVRDILHAPTFRSAVQTVKHQGQTIQLLPNKVRVGLSAVHALNQKAGIPLEIASDIIGRTWMISESIGKTLDFIPSSVETVILPNGDTVAIDALNGKEFDPLMIFDPYSSEEIPISILDEYLHLINGKYVCWSRPKEDAFQFLRDLHDVSNYQIHPAWDRQRPDMQF
ncbi:MAG TPA: YbaL family putative K(+) efflux transporter, partial [Terriglobales bacterium]|nr:YbaL family putative K(+) efflux transporter [Terriglobales bacterium]